MESKFTLDWSSNHTTLNPMPRWFSRNAVAVWNTQRFWILLPSVDLTQVFRRRGFSSLSSLRCSLRQIPHRNLFRWNSKKRRNSKNILTTRCKFFDKFVCNRRSMCGSFSLVLKIDARPFIDSYRTHSHFNDIVSTALVRSRHKHLFPFKRLDFLFCFRWYNKYTIV